METKANHDCIKNAEIYPPKRVGHLVSSPREVPNGVSEALEQLLAIRSEYEKTERLYTSLRGLLCAELERNKLYAHMARLREKAQLWHHRLIADVRKDQPSFYLNDHLQ